MCGIVGFSWSDEALLEDMQTCIEHRGPDDADTYVDDAISLGHRRLSILDLSSAGRQPMYASDGDLALVYNGEVYNHEALRSDLEDAGYEFKSGTDSEALLYAYDRWGEEFVERLNGMFAFAIYDRKEGEIFLARDHAGIKPLYYYHDGETFVFGSTITAILQHDIDVEPNDDVIRDFLEFGITDHTDETFFEGVRSFPKGHTGTFDLDETSLSIDQWWNVEFTGGYDGTYEDAVAELRAKIETAVERRLMADVPLGTCLSGGIDSSTIAALTSRDREVDTFSAVFPGFAFDESEYVDVMDEQTNIVSHRVTPTASELAADFDDLVRSIGEPVRTPSMFLQTRVFEAAEDEFVTVLLDGQGADELLAGYHGFWGYYIRGLLRDGSIGDALTETFALARNGEAKRPLLWLGFSLLPEGVREYYYGHRSILDSSFRRRSESALRSQRSEVGDLHDALEMHVDHKLEQLLKYEDRNSMRFSREARTPFLDVDVMEFISTLPESYIMGDGKTKRILHDAVEGLVPEEIRSRRDKIGFTSPREQWLASEEIQQLIRRRLVQRDPFVESYVDLETLRNAIDDESGRDRTDEIWRCLFLESWFDVFEDTLSVSS